VKKIIILVVVVALGYIGYSFMKSPSSYTVETVPTTNGTETKESATNNSPVMETKTDSKLIQRLGTASVSVAEDGTKVNLLNGTATFSTPDSNAKNTVSMGNVAVAKTFGKRNDVIAVVNLNSSGTLSQYLVLFGDNGTNLEQQSIAYLGQGLDVKSIIATDLPGSGEDYVVSVSANTQKPGKTATFIMPVKDGAFDTAKAISL
jgi:hypothetical protein